MTIYTKPFKYEFEGNLTSQNAYELKNELFKIINQGNINLSLTLSNVDESDIVGINAMALTHRLIKKLGGKLEIIIKQDSHLETLLHLTKFKNILTIIHSK